MTPGPARSRAIARVRGLQRGGALVLLLAACGLPGSPRSIPFGFTRSSARAQLALEDRFRSLPDPARIRDDHRELTRAPHPAGSPRDRELAEWIARQFSEAGMQDVRITTHEVMLPRPQEIGVEMIHPRTWRAQMQEEPQADPDTRIDPAAAGVPHHAFSASGDVTAAVVYAGHGLPRDYDWLARHGISVRSRIVLVRHAGPHSYRGYKAFVAEQRGAAGILMYSDPAEYGRAKGTVYPDGPWGPDSGIERGSVLYDFLVPGDPLTPGWSSVSGAPRIHRRDAVSLPKIVSAPMSARDAQRILETLGGAAAPDDWRGALPLDYRVGDGATRIRLNVRMDDRIGPVWTVTGMFRGIDFPDEVVMVGNHRDAWIYGGVDPSSGSAAVLELARALGSLVRGGWRPRRSILFASWDAEELGLTSSTEWGEQHEAWVRERVVAYLNVDSAASGSRFVAGAVPSLARLLTGIAETVRDPEQRVPVATVSRDRARTRGQLTSQDNVAPVVDDRLGGGSDYVVFVNFLGVPAADLAFDGPFGVYHSLYDTHQFVSRFADPGFRYHAALVEILGLAALRLGQADVLPLEPSATASRIVESVHEVTRRLAHVEGAPSVPELIEAATHLENVTSAFERARELAIERQDLAGLTAMNARILRFERAFLDPDGLPGRPWYRHVIYAPAFTYEPETLPGLNAAIRAGDVREIDDQAARVVAALRRAAARLDGR